MNTCHIITVRYSCIHNYKLMNMVMSYVCCCYRQGSYDNQQVTSVRPRPRLAGVSQAACTGSCHTHTFY